MIGRFAGWKIVLTCFCTPCNMASLTWERPVPFMSSIYAKLRDLLMFSEMCAPEYDTSELSDRILVFDIMPDGWETASILNSVSTAESTIEPNDMFHSVSVTTTSSKRSLEDSEEPDLKRARANTEITEQQDVNSPEITAQSESEIIHQHESGNCQEGAQLTENETQGLTDDQAKNNHDESPPLPELAICEKSATTSFTKIQKQEPLRQHKINIHSFWLSVQSTYFRSLLHSSGMKETHDTEVHLKIPESEENAHILLLKAMYHGHFLNRSKTSVDELLAVLELADKYDVKFVFKICKLILQKRATTFEICTKIMHVIKVKHNMNDVEDLAFTLQLALAKEFSPLDQNWESEKFTDLSKPSVKYLLDSHHLIVASENTVFHALIYWMEQNKVDADSLEETDDLLAVVRFKLATFDYLYTVIKEHPIASKMPKFNKLFLDGMIYHAAPSEQKEKMVMSGQPVPRNKSEKNVFVYTYLLTPQTYDACVGSKSNIKLGEFWACGYKMSVDMIHSSTYYDSSNYYPELTLHNLKWRSLVPLKFSIVNAETSKPAWQTETFETDESSSKKFPNINCILNRSGCTLFVYVEPL